MTGVQTCALPISQRASEAPTATLDEEEGPPPWMDEAPPADADEAPIAAPELDDMPLAPTAASDSGSRAPAPVADVPRTALGDRWAGWVQALNAGGHVTALVRELAMQAELVADDGTVCTLRIERDSLRNPALLDKLTAPLRQVTDRPALRLQPEPGVALDSPALREAEAARKRQAEAEAAFRADPLVMAALQRFNTARIVPGSVRPH